MIAILYYSWNHLSKKTKSNLIARHQTTKCLLINCQIPSPYAVRFAIQDYNMRSIVVQDSKHLCSHQRGSTSTWIRVLDSCLSENDRKDLNPNFVFVILAKSTTLDQFLLYTIVSSVLNHAFIIHLSKMRKLAHY